MQILWQLTKCLYTSQLTKIMSKICTTGAHVSGISYHQLLSTSDSYFFILSALLVNIALQIILRALNIKSKSANFKNAFGARHRPCCLSNLLLALQGVVVVPARTAALPCHRLLALNEAQGLFLSAMV